jgi:hypothetical protein
MEKSRVMMNTVPLVIFLFIFYAQISAVTAYNFTKTVDISANLKSYECVMVNVKSRVDSDQLQATCEGICNFYIFTEKEYVLFNSSQGKQGTPLDSKILVIPRTTVTLIVNSTSEHRLDDGLWNLVCNLYSTSTNRVNGFVTYSFVVSNWVIAVLIIGLITTSCCICSVIAGITVFCYRRFRAQPKEETYLPVEE